MKKRISPKVILLIFAVLLSPLTCCGGTYALHLLPASFPPNFFATEVRIENHTTETLYLTPITTTTGEPDAIQQLASIRQRDFPVKPGRSIVLSYDTDDTPLSGIAVCRTSDDCRLLETDHADINYLDQNAYVLDTYTDLPPLEPAWLAAVQTSPKRNMSIVVYPLLGLVPVILFASWVYLTVKDRKSRDTEPIPE